MEELLKHDLEDAYFYFTAGNLFIKLPIADVVVEDGNVNLELGTDGCSNLQIWKDVSVVKKIRRPANIIAKFEWCYLILNEYKEPIGYIGKK